MKDILQQDLRHSNAQQHLLLALTVVIVLSTLYSSLRMRIDERNDIDFAHYYHYSSLLAEGVNAYQMTPALREAAKRQSPVSVPIAGKPEYSPLLFTLFTPLTWLDWSTASWLYFFGQWAASLLLTLLLLRLFADRLPGQSGALLVIAAVYISWPMQVEIDTGNINLWLAAGKAGLAIAMLRHRHWTKIGEVVAALMILAKPQFALLLLLPIPYKRWGSMGRVLLYYLIGHLLGGLIYGFDVEIAWAANLIGNVTSEHLTGNPLNISLWGTISRVVQGWGIDGFGKGLAGILSVALIVAIGLRIGRDRQGDPRHHAALVSGLILIVSPLVFVLHHVLALLILLELATRVATTRWRMAFVALAFVLIQLRLSFERFPFTDSGPLTLLRSLPLVGVAIALILLWRNPPGLLRGARARQTLPEQEARAAGRATSAAPQ